MARIYKLIKERKEKDIENQVNKHSRDGWVLEKFDYNSMGQVFYWALMSREK
ncbi:MAG: hypothetical protein ACFE7E_07520 [Candidatus Hodarchaeota archaeon]